MSTTLPPGPGGNAAFTSTSMRPNSSCARCASARTCSRSVTSVATGSARRPWPRTSAAICSRVDGVRAASTTSAPSTAAPAGQRRAEPGPGADDHHDEPVDEHRALLSFLVVDVGGLTAGERSDILTGTGGRCNCASSMAAGDRELIEQSVTHHHEIVDEAPASGGDRLT